MKKFIESFGDINNISNISEMDSFEQFSQAGLIPKGGFNAPLYAMWELTSACPNKCIYCYNDSHYRRNELSTKRKFEIADELIELGVFQICLTGGEPLVCREYFDLMRYFRTNGVEVGTILSGAGLTPKKAKKISEYINMIQISLDGSCAEIHDKVRARKGSFEEAINAINYFVKFGVDVRVSFATTKFNIDDFENTYTLCKNLGVRSIRTQRLSVSGRVKENESDIYASEVQYKNLEKTIEAKQKERGMFIEYRSPAEHIQFGLKNGYATVARIDSEGLVGISPYIDAYFGDLKKENLQEVWNKMKMGWHSTEMLQLAMAMDERNNGTLVDPLTERKFIGGIKVS